ncbi:DUF2946 family protein [Castellaniella sp. MT123]|uniref:DUF2946 family protein n=1 Tax=Castellaniella sp. MT123 TaxID=3140381 RepID=UPI0031F430B9|nr:DUF2946 family protein [Castellaniella sp.]
MDDQVLAAMARWPNVPAVHGWLSLSARGQWRLHPHGQGWGAAPEEPGEAITNPQILAFIGRNYLPDGDGRWFFQNGPQRVYVRLDGAPWILRTEPDTDGRSHLLTHTDQPYGPVTHWWLDAEGRLYTQSACGAGLVTDRDLAQMVDMLRTPDGQPLSAWLEQADLAKAGTITHLTGGTTRAPFSLLGTDAVEATLGFIRRP